MSLEKNAGLDTKGLGDPVCAWVCPEHMGEPWEGSEQGEASAKLCFSRSLCCMWRWTGGDKSRPETREEIGAGSGWESRGLDQGRGGEFGEDGMKSRNDEDVEVWLGVARGGPRTQVPGPGDMAKGEPFPRGRPEDDSAPRKALGLF